MLSKPVAMWAQAFFYKELKLAVLPIPEENADKVQQLYTEYFIKPLTKLAYGEERQTITDGDLMSLMSQMRNVKIHDIYHLLKPISAQKLNGAKFDDRLNSGYEALKKHYIDVYAIVKGGSEFLTLADGSGDLAGVYPEDVNVVVLGELQRFKRGLNLNSMIKSNPIQLTDFCIQAIHRAVDNDIVSVDDLYTTDYIIPTENGFERLMVNAITPNLPGYFTRTLIEQLPPAYVAEFESPYHAALQYASEHDNLNQAYKELSKIVAAYNTHKRQTEKEVTAELTTDIAIDFLAEKYNIDKVILTQFLSVPTIDKQWDMYEWLHDKYPTKTVAELRSMLPEEHQGLYIDDIILASLREYSIDPDITLMDYIAFCRNEEDANSSIRTIREWVADYAEEHNIDIKHSLEWFLNEGDMEESTASEEVIYDAINSCDNIAQERKADIIKALKGESTLGDLNTELIGLGVPGDTIKLITDAKSTGTPFKAPSNEITNEVVADYLTQHGIPRVYASQLSEGSQEPLKTNITRKDISDYLSNIGFTQDSVDTIVAGHIPTTPVDEDAVYGYLMNKSIPAEIASQIAAGQLPSSKPSMDQIIDYLVSTGISSDDANSIAGGNIPSTKVDQSADLHETGYMIAESILHDLRKAVQENDSPELRSGMYGVVQGYLRIMMLKKGDEEDALEFLKGILSYSPDDPKFGASALNDLTRPFLQKAIQKLEDYIKETK